MRVALPALAAAQYKIVSTLVRVAKRFVFDQTISARPSRAMETIGGDPPGRAEQSCASCKRLKRRCSKDLPTCQLCFRVGRRCDYPSFPSIPTRSDTEPRAGRIRGRTGTPASFPFRSDVSLAPFVSNAPSKESSELATCFLDSVATRGVEVTPPSTLLWRDVCLGGEEISKDEASNIVYRYFSTTHSWLPISESPRDHESLIVVSDTYV
jgi:hypothetical protein